MSSRQTAVYEPLLTEDNPASPLDPGYGRSQRDNRSVFAALFDPVNAYRVLAVSVLLSVAISVVNLTTISAIDALNAYAYTRSPKDTPSVYAGLEKLAYTAACRQRTTYPIRYAVVESGDLASSRTVHAYRDEISFKFGGSTAAFVTFRIADYGLENCTMSFGVYYPPALFDGSPSLVGARNALKKTSSELEKEPSGKPRAGYMDSTTIAVIPLNAALKVYVVSSASKNRKQVMPLSTHDLSSLRFANDTVTTPAFHCKSQTEVSLLVECPGECQWSFGLQGMTSDTASRASAKKTGFSLEQWEQLSCIKG